MTTKAVRPYNKVAPPRPLLGTDSDVLDELKQIAKANNGVLEAEEVVRAARHKNSPLHDKFEWNDGAAAEKFRVIQARTLINVSVEYYGDAGNEIPSRVFVKIAEDHSKENLGYRLAVNVRSSTQMENKLLETALSKMDRFRERYGLLRELEPLFREIDRIKKTMDRKALAE